ncbi:MAG TPA: biopolymer transporter ExbD [Alphaproteobacteria bacterium]|nr:biopolymer transporter ExbD [Alphaproteobacteria bacterium]
MRKGPRGSQINLVGTINVTPFVDVLLVLLALTIVFASDFPGQKQVEQGAVAGALGGEFEDTDTVTLEIAQDGTVVLAGQVIEVPDIPAAVGQLGQQRQRNLVINISSQQQVGYDRVFRVLQGVNESNAAGVTFSIYE